MALDDEDRFIPVRYHELADRLAEALVSDPDRRPAFAAVAESIHDVILQEATSYETRLADAYAAVNPDRDTLTRQGTDEEDQSGACDRLRRHLTYLLKKANFIEIPPEEFEAALNDANSQGLRLVLDDDKVDQMALYYRGKDTIERTVRNWKTRYRARPVPVPVYRRFAIVVKLRAEPWLYLKLFKDIPRMDIEALLPHAQVRMNLFDRIKLAGSGAGALGGTLSKLFGLFKAALIGSRFLWILVFGLVLLLVRTITGYRNIRTRRDAMRTQNLYYQNLDNNAGVIHTLVAMVSQEEAKEALLAYALCRAAKEPVKDLAELDAHVERFLADQFGITPDFEIADAAETLARLALLTESDDLAVHDLETARSRLVKHWQSRATADYHETMAAAQ